MEVQSLRQKDLVDVFGTESIVSDVLNGRRELRKQHIQKLSARFGISPAVFTSSLSVSPCGLSRLAGRFAFALRESAAQLLPSHGHELKRVPALDHRKTRLMNAAFGGPPFAVQQLQLGHAQQMAAGSPHSRPRTAAPPCHTRVERSAAATASDDAPAAPALSENPNSAKSNHLKTGQQEGRLGR